MAFLLFFRRLGENVSGQRLHWWCAFAYTAATYFVGIGTIYYGCLAPSFTEIAVKCSTPASKRFDHDTLISNLVIDITSDLLILTIPIRMLWKVHIRFVQKLKLAGIFCLVMITITIAIIRFAVVSKLEQPEQSWLYFWNTIETAIAIIIACLASFRALFRKQEQHVKIQGNTSDPPRRFFERFMSILPWSASWRSGRRSLANTGLGAPQSPNGKASQEEILKPAGVDAQSNFEMSDWNNHETSMA